MWLMVQIVIVVYCGKIAIVTCPVKSQLNTICNALDPSSHYNKEELIGTVYSSSN